MHISTSGITCSSQYWKMHWGLIRISNRMGKRKRGSGYVEFIREVRVGLDRLRFSRLGWVNDAGLHRCTRCRKWMTPTRFYKNPKAKRGTRHRCKTCEIKYARKRVVLQSRRVLNKSADIVTRMAARIRGRPNMTHEKCDWDNVILSKLEERRGICAISHKQMGVDNQVKRIQMSVEHIDRRLSCFGPDDVCLILRCFQSCPNNKDHGNNCQWSREKFLEVKVLRKACSTLTYFNPYIACRAPRSKCGRRVSDIVTFG